MTYMRHFNKTPNISLQKRPKSSQRQSTNARSNIHPADVKRIWPQNTASSAIFLDFSPRQN